MADDSDSWIPRTIGWSLLAAVVLSLVLPSVPSYDPFAWIVWGREITEGALTTTSGPSWKPFPVFFTTVFALFGEAAPWLWLVVALAGCLAALVACWMLIVRLDGGRVGAAAGVGALALAPWWITHATRANSEGLMVFFVLATLERMLAGRHRAAFIMGCSAALLRPECWPFLGVYGLWLLWRGALPRTVVVGAGVAVLACWLLPEWWGSGDPLRAGNRARTGIGPQAPTNADSPTLAILRDAADMLVIPVLVGLVAAIWDAVRSRDALLASLVGLSGAWLGVVALMTSGGFSGNQRYLIVPVVLLIVVSGAGLGRMVTTLGRRSEHRWLAAAAAAAVFAVPSIGLVRQTWDKAAYQEAMTKALPDLIADVGGANSVRRCGLVSTGRFLVPQVAWYMHLHQMDVSSHTLQPGTVFMVRTTRRARWEPADGAITTSPVAVQRSWQVYQRCREAAT